ncbi:hypothetical protein BVX95_00330 [archaeon D22]|nr:hypothetical protein BVX95_00330 [archaeon D22]
MKNRSEIKLKNKGLEIFCRLSEPDKNSKSIVIMIHGYKSSSSKEFYETYQNEFDKLKINSIVFDLTGHGKSSGVFETQKVSDWISDADKIHEYIVERGYKNISIIGSSLGGLIAIDIASKHKIQKLILRAPLVDFSRKIHSKYGRLIKIKLFVAALFMKKYRDMYKFANDATKYNLFEKARSIKSRTLILHGNKDGVIPFQSSERLNKCIKNSRLVILDNADHDLIINGSRKEQDKHIIDFVKNG